MYTCSGSWFRRFLGARFSAAGASARAHARPLFRRAPSNSAAATAGSLPRAENDGSMCPPTAAKLFGLGWGWGWGWGHLIMRSMRQPIPRSFDVERETRLLSWHGRGQQGQRAGRVGMDLDRPIGAPRCMHPRARFLFLNMVLLSTNGPTQRWYQPTKYAIY